jgi:hypothetical protein
MCEGLWSRASDQYRLPMDDADADGEACSWIEREADAAARTLEEPLEG